MNFKFNKLVLAGGISAFLSISANAADVKIGSYGYVGAMYNQGFSNTSTIGLSARAGANFNFNNGLQLGLGATGSWAAYDKNSGSFGGLVYSNGGSQYPNTGDVSDAFIRYNGNNWKIAVGRFDASFLDFDYLSDNIQGVGFTYDNLYKKGVVDRMDLWVTYFNSFLTTGKQPNRIASELSTMYAFHPGGRAEVGMSGGNVVAAGLNMNIAGFIFDPYLLFNNSAAINRDILVQVGGKFGYVNNFARNWKSSTFVRASFEYAKMPVDEAGFLAWVDQEFAYNKWLEFGLGFYFLGGHGIWTINDHSRFYGGYVNAYSRAYFADDNWSFYVFGSFDLLSDRLGIDVMLAGGNYTEFSAVLNYTAWKGNTMKTDVGGGYVYSDSKNGGVLNNAGNLILFAKLSY